MRATLIRKLRNISSLPPTPISSELSSADSGVHWMVMQKARTSRWEPPADFLEWACCRSGARLGLSLSLGHQTPGCPSYACLCCRRPGYRPVRFVLQTNLFSDVQQQSCIDTSCKERFEYSNPKDPAILMNDKTNILGHRLLGIWHDQSR